MNSVDVGKLDNLAFTYITDSQSLRKLCESLSAVSAFAMDTEFVRTRTLYPDLGLIQVFDGHHLALIDPVLIDDLTPFCDLLNNQNITKVLHSCSEDIDALHRNLGTVPQPLFDTQFAASLLGKGASIGYANLVSEMFDISLDKGESRTDWIARPLSDSQLSYAAADVTYLLAAYQVLNEQIQTQGLHECVIQESQQLIHKKTTLFPAEYAYLLYSNNWKLRGKHLLAFKLLAKWRMELAREQNVAINFIIKESSMIEIAQKLPLNISQLHQLHALFGKQIRLYGNTIIAIVEKANAADESEYPPRVKRLMEFSSYKKAMSDLKAIVDTSARQHNIPEAVLASKKQLTQVLKWCWFSLDECALQGIKPDLLSAWRRPLVIDALEQHFDYRDQHANDKHGSNNQAGHEQAANNSVSSKQGTQAKYHALRRL
uniref:ribonuclease D n=1 Tax=Ningiella ruwaisensis TaxID=2364274 RepID=UPI0014450AB7|nr:ribonuclease D [Ningiella ruwaisensis]